MPQRNQTGAAFFIILLLFWLLFPLGEYPGQPGLLISDLAKNRLKRYHDALDVLNHTQWGQFAPTAATPTKETADETDDIVGAGYLNLTGFRKIDGLAWEDLGRFREKSLQLSHHTFSEVDGRQLWDIGQGEHVWMNASGTLHGDWVYRAGSVVRGHDGYNLSNSVPSMSWIGDDLSWHRNVTGSQGKMLLRMHGNRTMMPYEQLPKQQAPLAGGLIRNVKATLTMEDTSGSGHTWDMRLWGLHWPRQGVIMMTTTSEKFEGIFGLPHLTPSADYFASGQALLKQTLASVLAKKEKTVHYDQTMPWGSDVGGNVADLFSPTPQCEYIMYAQVQPPERSALHVGSRTANNMDMAAVIGAIEAELAFPRGAPIGHVPRLKMSAVLYSPDCAFFLETRGPPDFPASESNHLIGMKAEVHTHQVKTWLLMFTCVILGQVYLLKNQMRESFTPSTIGRVSFWTISVVVVVDGMTFTAAATWVSSAGATFLPTLALMFVSFLSMAIGGSFLAKIYDVQGPERQSRQDAESATITTNATPRQPSPPTTTTGGSLSEPLLPTMATAGRRLGTGEYVPVIVPSDGDVDAEINVAAASAVPGLPITGGQTQTSLAPTITSFQTIVGRFILLGLLISFVSLSSSTWYPQARSVYLNTCAFVYLSLWVPQIYRNIMRNCRRALTWPFVIGQSVLRLLPIAYFWLRDDNFMFAEPDRPAFALLCGWVWLQLFILGTQDVIGPRFAVPKGWAPEAWDYHPILREDSLEAGGLPIGLITDDAPTILRRSSAVDAEIKSKGAVRVIDCSICRENLEVPVFKDGNADMSVAGVLARRMYMVTPCRHIFHTGCLESWMKFRLQCPICREDLPPL